MKNAGNVDGAGQLVIYKSIIVIQVPKYIEKKKSGDYSVSKSGTADTDARG